MLFITEQTQEYALRKGDVVKYTVFYNKLSIQHDTDSRYPATLEYSNDGYSWQLFSKVENTTDPIQYNLPNTVKYLRLVSDSHIHITVSEPSLRTESKNTPEGQQFIDITQFIRRAELANYLLKNDYTPVVVPDVSPFITKEEVETKLRQLAETIPAPLEAIPEEVLTKLELCYQALLYTRLYNNTKNQDALRILNEYWQDTSHEIEETFTLHEQLITELTNNKADNTTVANIEIRLQELRDLVNNLGALIDYANNQYEDAITTQELNDAITRIHQQLETKASLTNFEELLTEISNKVGTEWVAQNTATILGLIQDKANKLDVVRLSKQVSQLSLLLGVADGDVIEEKVFKHPTFLKLSSDYAQLAESVKLLESSLDKLIAFTGYEEGLDLTAKVREILGE